MNSLAIYFNDLPDPRQRNLLDHPLINILTIVLLSSCCGASGWEEMQMWAECRREWLATFLDVSMGLPSADTLRRVMAALLPGPFRKAFIAWSQAIVQKTQGKLIAIDGKTVRGSARPSEQIAALHVVRAWVCENHLVLGQIATEEKSNEITAIPQLLDLLSIEGATISIDAMGTQRAIATKILEKKAEYLMAVKDNQPTMALEIAKHFRERAERARNSARFHRTEEQGHGRWERRRVWVETDLDGLASCEAWPGAKTMVCVESERTTDKGISFEERFFISSRTLRAKEAAQLVRGHWGIENACHWTLDVMFREDDSRIWEGHAPENLAVIRNLLLAALKQDTLHKKRSLKQRMKLCAWDNNYLHHILQSLF